jgi:hypothetical protein
VEVTRVLYLTAQQAQGVEGRSRTSLDMHPPASSCPQAGQGWLRTGAPLSAGVAELTTLTLRGQGSE